MTTAGNELERVETIAPPLLVLNSADVVDLLDLATAIESQHYAFGELGAGRTQLADRLLLDGPDGAVSFCYASRVSTTAGAVTKFGSVVPANAEIGLPVVSAIVIVLDDKTGLPAAIVDGTALTTLRTSAASAVAARELAPSGARTLAMIGSGVQAKAHIRALAYALPLTHVKLWARRRESAEAAAAELADLEVVIEVVDTAESAVRGADIVVTCTTSLLPVVRADWVGPGALVISVGSFAPDRCEVGPDLVDRAAAIVVDHVPTALEQAGPIVAAIAAQALRPEDLLSLGEVIVQRRDVRSDPDDIVFYNTVGLGVQDAASAQAIIAKARLLGLGTTLAW